MTFDEICKKEKVKFLKELKKELQNSPIKNWKNMIKRLRKTN